MSSLPSTPNTSTTTPALPDDVAAALKRDERGLVTAVVQQWDTGEVLMVAWMDDEALALTLSTRRGTYFSRSRNQIWVKGETSGHVQQVREVRLDCDGDTLLVKVDQTDGACHTGDRTCFDARILLPIDGTPVTTATTATTAATAASA